MLFDELELNRMEKRGFKNIDVHDEIKFNILNFLHCIHLNKQDFFRNSFNSQLFGDLEMTFKKKPNSLIGHCKVFIKAENKEIIYLYTENGYELLDDVLKD